MKPFFTTRYIVLSLFVLVVVPARMPAHAQEIEQREFSRFQNRGQFVGEKAHSVTPG